MPTDNQPAKSYIATVMARVNQMPSLDGYRWEDGAIACCQDIPTLAKMLLRAIEVLEYESIYTNDMYAVGRIDAALADINALAAKGSQ